VDGFLIIPGVEVSTAQGHLLCIGATTPNFRGLEAREVARRVRLLGGLAIPAHPFDLFRAGIREDVLDTIPDLDGIEVFNAAISLKRHNAAAEEYARRRGLPMTAGSDAHEHEVIGRAYTVIEADSLTVSEILGGIRRGPTRHEQYLTGWEKFRKTWNNWLRLKKRRLYPEAQLGAE
jgi:predicted metal-dependent phosphoesterase TrpH